MFLLGAQLNCEMYQPHDFPVQFMVLFSTAFTGNFSQQVFYLKVI